MAKLKQVAVHHPVGFGLIVSFVFVVFTILTGVVTYPVQGDVQKQIVSGLVRLIGSIFLLWILWRFGWIKDAGIPHLGRQSVWSVVLPVIFYTLLTHTYAFFGKFAFKLGRLDLALSVFLNSFTGGLLQEIVYRSLILYAMVRAWGHTRVGLMKSAVISALFFGTVHIFNLLNLVIAAFSPITYQTPVGATGMQILNTCLSGFVYAVIVIYGESLWPVAVYHGLLNATINVLWTTTPEAVETVNSWILITLFKLPLLVIAYVLLNRIKPEVLTNPKAAPVTGD